jgi:dTMP kinase
MTNRGLFLSFEGLDGAGKSTQIGLLHQRLEALGHTVVLAVEPGGTRIGQKIREILLNPDHAEMDARAELLLYFAARAQNLSQVIQPALGRNCVVLCDRYTDSTIAYQGAARGLGIELVKQAHQLACGSVWPDRTIFLDLDAATSQARTNARGEKDRLEDNDAVFFERIRQGFLHIAQQEPQRFQVIDATGQPTEVAERIWHKIGPLLSRE